jgi:hypothetical protein
MEELKYRRTCHVTTSYDVECFACNNYFILIFLIKGSLGT